FEIRVESPQRLRHFGQLAYDVRDEWPPAQPDSLGRDQVGQLARRDISYPHAASTRPISFRRPQISSTRRESASKSRSKRLLRCLTKSCSVVGPCSNSRSTSAEIASSKCVLPEFS